MTPLQLSQAECVNHHAGGVCLGVDIADPGEDTHCRPRPRCALSAGERCAYFEECVAPMVDIATEPRRAKAIQEAVLTYRMRHADASVATRKCPDCGGALQKFRRVCPACADKRRKATFRQSQRRRRGTDVDLSTEVPKKDPDSLGNSRGFAAVSRKPYEDSRRPQNGETSVDMQASATAAAERSAAG
jgi:hypothetical protein